MTTVLVRSILTVDTVIRADNLHGCYRLLTTVESLLYSDVVNQYLRQDRHRCNTWKPNQI